MTREQVENFLVAYHYAVWTACQDGNKAYDEAGRELAKDFLSLFENPEQAVVAQPVSEGCEHGTVTLRDALHALHRLNDACNRRASLLTPEAYRLAEQIPGMRDVLYELDDARMEASAVQIRAQSPQAKAGDKHD